MAFCRCAATWIVPPTTFTREKPLVKFDKGKKSLKKVNTVARQVFPPNEETPLLKR